MARSRRRFRGSVSLTSDGSVSGIMEPPPHVVKEFEVKWKNWLNNLFNTVSLNIATAWYNITDVDDTSSPYQVTIVDHVILADPATGNLVITLPAVGVEDGISIYIKNIDESGTYTLTIDPGTNKIDGQPAGAAPATTDVVLAPLDSYQLIFDSNLSTWWII